MKYDIYIKAIHENGALTTEGYSSAAPKTFDNQEELDIAYANIQSALGSGSKQLEWIVLFSRVKSNLSAGSFAVPENVEMAPPEIILPGAVLDKSLILTQVITYND